MPTSNDLNDLKLQVKRSKISVENFKSKSFFGSSKEFASFHKTIGNLAGHVRKVVIRVGSLEKIVNNQSKKIKSLKNISKLQGPQIRGTNIGAKLPGGSTDNLDKTISTIADTISSIAETLKAQKKVSDSANENDRRRREKEKGDVAENKLEKRFEGLKKIAEKIIAPVKSILDKIINFLVNVLLGRVVIKLLDWLADPKNASKVKSIIRFIGDWWPALLGAYVLFGTTFGAFVRGTVGMLGRFIIQIGKVAIPGLLKFIARNPLGAAATALFLTGAGAELVPGLTGKKEEETKKAPGSTKDKIQQLQTQKANLNVFEKLQGKGSEIDEQISLLQTGKTKGYGFSGGGFNGFVSGEKGVDKVPAMLSDGEFVMSRGAVDLYGVDQLMSMNAAGGGTNRPKIIGGVPHAAGGGPIGSIYEGVDRASGGKLKPVVDEIIRGLSSQYKWANDLARKTGVSLSGVGNNAYNAVMRSGPSNLIQQANQAALQSKRSGGNALNGIFKYGQQQLQDFAAGSGPASSNIINQGISFAKRTAKGFKNPLDSPSGVEKWAEKFEKNDYKKEYGAVTKRLEASDKDIASIYDPKRDKGPLGNVKKLYQDVRNKGVIPDFLKGLKSEGVENFAEKISGGRIKNLGAKITGLQYVGKALLGPLGSAFRINNDALKRYTQPAVEYYRKHGQSGVGAAGLGQPTYNRFMNDRIANLALGQFNFKVGKNGKAITNDVYDSNKTATQYFSESRKGLRSGNVTEAAFKGLSGVLRILQAKGWTNLRPGGSGIVVAEGLNKSKNSAQLAKSKPVAKPVKPPAKPQAKVVYGPPVPSRPKGKPGGAPKSKVPNFTAGAPGMRSKTQTLGLMR
jgi:hypothetical protein